MLLHIAQRILGRPLPRHAVPFVKHVHACQQHLYVLVVPLHFEHVGSLGRRPRHQPRRVRARTEQVKLQLHHPHSIHSLPRSRVRYFKIFFRLESRKGVVFFTSTTWIRLSVADMSANASTACSLDAAEATHMQSGVDPKGGSPPASNPYRLRVSASGSIMPTSMKNLESPNRSHRVWIVDASWALPQASRTCIKLP